jgi:hypothetical protein
MDDIGRAVVDFRILYTIVITSKSKVVIFLSIFLYLQVLFYLFRDYIKSWYRKISEHESFPHDIRLTMQRVIIAFSERSKQVDWVPYFTTRLVDDFASHLRLYRRSQEKVAIYRTDGENVLFALSVFLQETNLLDERFLIQFQNLELHK